MKITALIENTPSTSECNCDHGLSLLIETDRKKILFNSGAGVDFTANAEQLRIDFSSIDIAIISHGHYDNSEGMIEFLRLNPTASVYAREGFDLPHYDTKGEDVSVSKDLTDDPRIIVVKRGRMELGSGVTIVGYPTKRPVVPTESCVMFEIKDGKPTFDEFAHEQYIIVSEKGKKTIFTGCSYRGIVNITAWAREDGVTGVVGGFQVIGEKKSEIDKYLFDTAWGLLDHPCKYLTWRNIGTDNFDYMKGIMGDRLNCIEPGESVII